MNQGVNTYTAGPLSPVCDRENLDNAALGIPEGASTLPRPKACQACNRIEIAQGFVAASRTRAFAGLFFVYAPIIFLPLFILCGSSVYIHLRLMGAQNLKTLRDFMPNAASHRYSYKTQITNEDSPSVAFWTRLRAFWIFNCTFYCPTSVAVLEWNTYLVKAVENWWCPFNHSKKTSYASSPLDSSYWHQTADVQKLHAEDRANPIWNARP
jgi:hypothetical protein